MLSSNPLFFPWPNKCWQFELWFPHLFESQLVHLEVLGSCTADTLPEGFWAEAYEHVKWSQLYSRLNILWHCSSLELEWKLTFSNPVATAEFSKFAGEGNGNPFQYSCLENPRDGEAWWAEVYGVAQSQTWLTWLSRSSSWHTKCSTLTASSFRILVAQLEFHPLQVL